LKEMVRKLWTGFTVLKALRYNPECKCLHLRQSRVFALAIGQDTRSSKTSANQRPSSSRSVSTLK